MFRLSSAWSQCPFWVICPVQYGRFHHMQLERGFAVAVSQMLWSAFPFSHSSMTALHSHPHDCQLSLFWHRRLIDPVICICSCASFPSTLTPTSNHSFSLSLNPPPPPTPPLPPPKQMSFSSTGQHPRIAAAALMCGHFPVMVSWINVSFPFYFHSRRIHWSLCLSWLLPFLWMSFLLLCAMLRFVPLVLWCSCL